jgi:hypothetical protein
MSTRRRCCYGMPAAARLMRQGKERWLASAKLDFSDWDRAGGT